MKIGIFGGTFNPPHIGHIQSSKTAAEQLGLDLLIIVPSGIPPHKTLPEGSPSAQARKHMTSLAFAGIPDIIISDIEINNRNPVYTVDTVAALKRDYPDAEFYLLVGTDMYLTLDVWKDSKTLLKMATPAVFSRSEGESEKIASFGANILERFGVETMIISNDVIDISSSELREMLMHREGIRYIADTNYSYIISNRYYGAKPDWDWLREGAYAMHDPGRLPHVQGCEETAIQLAKRWGASEDNALEAAILHDITKKLTLDENMKVFNDYGVSAAEYESIEEKLLHSRTGAHIAREQFGVSQEVFDAIYWHTTGRADMSVLEKIMYLADYIEPNRDIPGVEDLRALAFSDIDRAMILGLRMSLDDLAAQGIVPNRLSVDALEYLLKQE